MEEEEEEEGHQSCWDCCKFHLWGTFHAVVSTLLRRAARAELRLESSSMQKPNTPPREDVVSSEGGPSTTLFLPMMSDESPFVFSNMVVGLCAEAVVMLSSGGFCEASRFSCSKEGDTNGELRLHKCVEEGVVVVVVCWTSA